MQNICTKYKQLGQKWDITLKSCKMSELSEKIKIIDEKELLERQRINAEQIALENKRIEQERLELEKQRIIAEKEAAIAAEEFRKKATKTAIWIFWLIV